MGTCVSEILILENTVICELFFSGACDEVNDGLVLDNDRECSPDDTGDCDADACCTKQQTCYLAEFDCGDRTNLYSSDTELECGTDSCGVETCCGDVVPEVVEIHLQTVSKFIRQFPAPSIVPYERSSSVISRGVRRTSGHV